MSNAGPPETRSAVQPAFAEVYQDHAQLVWRNLRRLGVPERLLEDATQDVFLVVHRRLGEFEGRSSLRTWVFGIVMRVAARHRRRERGFACRERFVMAELAEVLSAPKTDSPYERALLGQAIELVRCTLERLDIERRALLLMVDFEQASVSEAAQTLQINVNTAHSRLRAARRDFATALTRRLGNFQT